MYVDYNIADGLNFLRTEMLVAWSSAGIGFSSYTLSSSISIIPWSIVFVYFGSLVTTLADVLDGKAGPEPSVQDCFLRGLGAASRRHNGLDHNNFAVRMATAVVVVVACELCVALAAS